MSGRTLSDSGFGHIVDAPIERVDIADWLLRLTHAEYQRCCPCAHIAAGTTTTDDGQPLLINVEMICASLLIHQYLGEVTDPRRCRLVSTSDVFARQGRTSARVVWELSVEPLDDASCEYVNHLTATATEGFLAFLETHQIPFAQAAAACDRAARAHNEQETPLVALSIERHAVGVASA